MPAATYYARRYYTGRSFVRPARLPGPPLHRGSLSLPPRPCRRRRRRRSPTAHFPLSRRPRCIRAQLRPLLPLRRPLFVGVARRVPMASRANFDPPMATRRRLPRAGKLISPRIHALVATLPRRRRRRRPTRPPSRLRIRGRRVSGTYPRGGGRTRGRRPLSGDENSVSSIFAGGCRVIGLSDYPR